ncbi:hypothetical protein GCM10027270_29220 [Nocardioides ginkgobilobae]
MCAKLAEHGIKISPSTYYEWGEKKPTRRQLRDEEVIGLIVAMWERNRLNARLGSRNMWIKLREAGHDVARCTVERLYRDNDWEGARYGSKHTTTRPDERHERSPDLVDRDFAPATPNRLWVADSPMSRPGPARSTSRSSSTPSLAAPSAGVLRGR